jgi:anti-sigma factor RsiW
MTTTHRSSRPPVECLALLGELSDYIDDELSPRERRAIDVHCRDCARCKRMIAGLRRTVSLLRRAGSSRLTPRALARARANIAHLLKN